MMMRTMMSEYLCNGSEDGNNNGAIIRLVGMIGVLMVIMLVGW